ncbi:MAG: metallophosphoesterase [Clostridia bacterium]|nr:metallophosphoesterase [Clostridia bacterium]
MNKIVILSDTHKNLRAISSILEIMDESDFVFHLGDHNDDMNDFLPILKNRLYRVHGNCDYGATKEIVVEIGGRKILATHGDLYGVKGGLGRLEKRAKELTCDTVFYGHTHAASIEERGGIIFVNPGCMTYYAPEKSFCYAVIDGGKMTAVINRKV